MTFAVIVFVIALFAGVPIAFVLGLAGVTHLVQIGDPSFFNVIVPRMFAGMDIMGLTCIPFFIVAGEVMNASGVTGKLLEFTRSLIGHFRGGLAYAVVFIAMILSAILGSANAVASILCAVMIPEMSKDKYPEEFSGALIASSGILGPVIPPSVTFVYFSVLSNVSVNGLFMGGIVPGILLGLGFATVIFFKVRKFDLPKGEPFRFKRLLKATFQALPALLVPIIIVGGIMSGAFTPTESGAVAVFAAFLAGLFYRKFKLSMLPGIFTRAAIATSGIFLIIGFGNIIGWSMAIDKIPQAISAAILGFTTSKTLIIFIMLGLLVLVGCVMEATAAMLIFTPVLLPIATAIGMNPIHFGIVFCIMLTIALVTPPVGMVLFVTSNISKISLNKLSGQVLPFVAVAFVITIIIAFAEPLVMWIPTLLGI
ncbi:TRAP transporter large permease [Fusibacter paucivorans]|uniref:TRAP transporter large permease n=1 Tax=Fusibacter paucivorans TaxID=76009 RepID=A0ABS5PQG8_9FIRM|nr:TRAP transporter large permease [Fusibacter paucivorans]MBS7527409.1 TRAP transporter large permease [Fusibacter paucivorans]